MPSQIELLIVATLVLAIRLFKHWLLLMYNGLQEPPGPQRLFILGNILDAPSPKEAHVYYTQQAAQYGPITRMKFLNKNVVIITSSKVVNDLLNKRGYIYSDRPRFAMAELSGWGWVSALRHHNDDWRLRRRLIHKHMNITTIPKHNAVLTRSALMLACHILKTPKDFHTLIQWMATVTILDVTYGTTVNKVDDPLVRVAVESSNSFSSAVIPGVWAVDIFPVLRYLPDWFPGASFKRYASENRHYSDTLLNFHFDVIKNEINHGVAISSMAADALAAEPDAPQIEAIKEAAGSMYLAGSDTTVSTILSFFLEMMRNPETQRKAQEQIDSVTGTRRLPTLADRESLPYVEAILREVNRLHPVVTLGIPHALKQDDVYEGMFLPKGTIVLPNIWGILRDASVYKDPEEFKPERFIRDGAIDPSVPDPKLHIFGYGRRICLGKDFADASLFITLSTILACFNICVPVEDGVRIEPKGTYNHGFISAPDPFKCTITPRSDSVIKLLEVTE